MVLVKNDEVIWSPHLQRMTESNSLPWNLMSQGDELGFSPASPYAKCQWVTTRVWAAFQRTTLPKGAQNSSVTPSAQMGLDTVMPPDGRSHHPLVLPLGWNWSPIKALDSEDSGSSWPAAGVHHQWPPDRGRARSDGPGVSLDKV